MKTPIADLSFDHHPDTRALRIATAAAFGIPVATITERDALDPAASADWENPLVAAIWLRDEEHPGDFPWPYTLALAPDNGEALGEPGLFARLGAITGALGQAAVLPRAFGDLLLLGPDGSRRIVSRDEKVAEGIGLLPEDREALVRAYATQRSIAG